MTNEQQPQLAKAYDPPKRKVAGTMNGRKRVFFALYRKRFRNLRNHDAAAQCNRRATHGPRPDYHDPRHVDPLPSHAG